MIQHRRVSNQNSESGKVVFTGIQDILHDGHDTSDNHYFLPPHQRCAVHTLNLIAVTDAEEACNDVSYKKIYRSTMAKCASLWNKTSRSSQAADIVQEKCKMHLIVPNGTRWNSFFYAVSRVSE